MAVPANARNLRGAPLKSGIILGVSPSSDPTFDVDIARATSSGSYMSIARLTPKGSGIPVSYTDILPVTTSRYSYKARAVKDGWLEGDYTAVVTARPIFLPEFPPPITPLTGKGIGAPLFISTGAPPTVGQKVATASVTKTLRVSPSEFAPASSTVIYSRGITSLAPQNSTSTMGFIAQASLPLGATVNKITVSYERASTVPAFAVQLYSATTGVAETLQYSKTSTATGGGILTLTSSSFSFTTLSNFAIIRVLMQTTGATTVLRNAELQYEMPNYNVTV